MADVQTDTGVMTDGSQLKSSVLNTADKLFLTNRSGGNAVTGDVLSQDTANASSFVYGSSTYPYSPCFVVPSDIGVDGTASVKTVANLESAWVFKPGSYVPLANVSAAVSIGEYLVLNATTKNFVGSSIILGNEGIAPTGAKAIALNSSAGAGQIPVFLLPVRPWMMHACQVYNDADEALTASVIKAVTFNQTVFDPLNMHDAGGDTTKITIPATLKGTAPFLITACANIYLAARSLNAYAAIRVDGATVVAKAMASYEVTLHAVVRLTAAQYVQLIAYTTSAGAVVYHFGVTEPKLSVVQIGEAYLG